MKTSRLVLAPAVAIALTGLAAAPAFAASTPTLPAGPFCAYDGATPSTGADDAVPGKSTPQATVSAAQVTRTEIIDSKKGIGFSGTGFTPDNKATVTVVGTEGTKYTPPTKLTVDEDGQVSGTYFFTATEGAQVPVGSYTLYLTDLKTEKISSKVTFEVVATEKDKDATTKAPECERPVAPAPSQTPSETAPTTEAPAPTTKAPATVPSAPAAKPPVKRTPVKPSAPAETTPTPTETTPAPTGTTPAETETPKSETPAAKKAPAADKADESKTPEAAPTSPAADVRAPAAVQAASLVISPTEISSEDFLNRGVKIGITGAKAGEQVTITVEQAQGRVDRYTMTKTADADGTVTFGVQAKVKAVLGTYNVHAQAASFDKPQGGSFTVVTNGTSVSADDTSSSNNLPRTGAEMTGLALGAGLLVIGAAAVIITRRRTRAGDDPAEF